MAVFFFVGGGQLFLQKNGCHHCLNQYQWFQLKIDIELFLLNSYLLRQNQLLILFGCGKQPMSQLPEPLLTLICTFIQTLLQLELAITSKHV